MQTPPGSVRTTQRARTDVLPEAAHGSAGRRVPDVLTAQERNVSLLLCEGMTAVAIAHRLEISPRTVEKHLENIYAKLGVCDRLGAVLCVHQMGGASLR